MFILSKKIKNMATTIDINTKNCVTCEIGCERCRIDSGKNKCDTFSFGYVMDSNGKCQKCSNLMNGCYACEYNEDNKLNCILCENEYNLKNGECKLCQLSNCDICEINEDKKKKCLACSKYPFEFLSGKYGLKDGKCEKCDTNDCNCIINLEENILECEIKHETDSKSFTYSLNIISYLLLILLNFI